MQAFLVFLVLFFVAMLSLLVYLTLICCGVVEQPACLRFCRCRYCFSCTELDDSEAAIAAQAAAEAATTAKYRLFRNGGAGGDVEDPFHSYVPPDVSLQQQAPPPAAAAGDEDSRRAARKGLLTPFRNGVPEPDALAAGNGAAAAVGPAPPNATPSHWRTQYTVTVAFDSPHLRGDFARLRHTITERFPQGVDVRGVPLQSGSADASAAGKASIAAIERSKQPAAGEGDSVKLPQPSGLLFEVEISAPSTSPALPERRHIVHSAAAGHGLVTTDGQRSHVAALVGYALFADNACPSGAANSSVAGGAAAGQSPLDQLVPRV